MMRLRVLKPGLLTTIQDGGRWAHLAEGVPVSGAMDPLAARIANIATGNSSEAPVLECTLGNARFKAETDLMVAYAGAGSEIIIAGKALPSHKPLYIPQGAVLDIRQTGEGCRTYISVAGGWDVPLCMGSRSTYTVAGFGGLNGRALQSGDALLAGTKLSEVCTGILGKLKSTGINYPPWRISDNELLPSQRNTIRFFPGREFTWFNAHSLIDFLSKPYRLSLKSNRMGYQLDGPELSRRYQRELISTAVTPGTVQVTGDGTPVILMMDCQTTGGYPRIGQVIAADLPLCGQLKPGDSINFQEIGRHDAEMLYIEQELRLQKLETAVKSRYL